MWFVVYEQTVEVCSSYLSHPRKSDLFKATFQSTCCIACHHGTSLSSKLDSREPWCTDVCNPHQQNTFEFNSLSCNQQNTLEFNSLSCRGANPDTPGKPFTFHPANLPPIVQPNSQLQQHLQCHAHPGVSPAAWTNLVPDQLQHKPWTHDHASQAFWPIKHILSGYRARLLLRILSSIIQAELLPPVSRTQFPPCQP